MPIARLRADFTSRIEAKRKYVAEHWPAEGIPQEVVDRAIAALVPIGVVCVVLGFYPQPFFNAAHRDLELVASIAKEARARAALRAEDRASLETREAAP